MISDIEAAHILIAMSRSKPRVVVKPKEKEENSLSVPVPRQKRSSLRVPRQQMRRSFPMEDPSSSSSTALVGYVSQENDHSPSIASPRIPPLSRKKPPMDPSSSTALVEYVGQEDASPPTMPPLSRKTRPRASSSTALVAYVSQEDASPPLSRKKRPPLFPPIGKQPKKKAKLADSSWDTEPPPDWLLELVEEEEEEVLKKIIEKVLSATDVSRGHNRLSMPCSIITDSNFLSPSEQRIIAEDELRTHKTGINAKLVVKFVDSDDLDEFDVNVRRWRMPKKSGSATYVYNLVTGWNKVVEGCGLRENHKIRVWSFHSDGRLCFALVLTTPRPPPKHPLPPPPSETEDANTEDMSSALVIYDRSNDDLDSK